MLLCTALLFGVSSAQGQSQLAGTPLESESQVPATIYANCVNIIELKNKLESADYSAFANTTECVSLKLDEVVQYCTDLAGAGTLTKSLPSDAQIESSIHSLIEVAKTKKQRSDTHAKLNHVDSEIAKLPAVADRDNGQKKYFDWLSAEKLKLTGEKTALADAKCSAPDTQKRAAGGAGMALSSTILEGASAFIAARLKAEIALAFEEQLFDDLCSKDQPGKLFPSTCELLKARQSSSDLRTWGVIKAAFEDDLKKLPTGVIDVVLPKTTADATLLLAKKLLPKALDLYYSLEQGQDLIETLKGLSSEQQAGTAWVDLSLYQRLMLVTSLSAEVLSDQPDVKLSGTGAAAFAKAALAKLIEKDARLAVLADDKMDRRLTALRDIRHRIEMVSRDLNGSDYNAATKASLIMHHTAKLIEQCAVLVDGESESKLVNVAQTTSRVAEMYDQARAADYAGALVSAVALAGDLELSDQLPSWLLTYGSFAAELAGAKDSEAAQKTIEAAALPVGSFRNKRRRGNFTLTLTALPGMQGGGEWLIGSDTNSAETFGAQAGFFAPVGLDFAWGISKECGHSIGFFASIIDLGALVSYRLQQDEITVDGDTDAVILEEPEIGFAQVVSPGLFVNYGVGKIPLVLGGGIAISPKLRSLKLDGTQDTLESTAVRVMGFVAIDVSIFSIVP